MEKKSIFITTVVTIFLFSFVLFLIYVIYCFSFYDKNQEDVYLSNYNMGKYDFFYDKMVYNKYITKEDFNYSVNLMFKKNKLNEIYNTYYSNLNNAEFINTYFFRRNVSLDDIRFLSQGKTSLFKRKKLLYKSITIRSVNGLESSFGVKKDISFVVDDNTKLSIDEKGCEVKDNICSYSYIMGGLHTVLYEIGDVTYFGLVNVVKDESKIDINGLDSLIKVNNVLDVVDDIDVSLDE